MHFEFSYLGLYINHAIFRKLIKLFKVLKTLPNNIYDETTILISIALLKTSQDYSNFYTQK